MAVSDPEFVVPALAMEEGPADNRPDLAGAWRDACAGKEIGADSGPEEQRLYRHVAENQGVPGARWLGYGEARFRPRMRENP